MLNLAEVQRLLHKYDYDDAIHSPYYGYGTAGFRFLATELPPIMVRVGIALALLVLQETNENLCSVLGVMVTASHNTQEYNGVKLAKADGGMMDAKGEQLVGEIVNERNIDRILQRMMQQKASLSRLTNHNSNEKRIIFMGMDTREHSMSLSCLIASAIRAVEDTSSAVIEIRQLGQVTTPQMHWMVRHTAAVMGYISIPTCCSLPFADLDGYDQAMVQSYKVLIATTTKQQNHHLRKLYVDCANGVGYPHIQRLQSFLPFLEPRNGPGDGPLNEKCGSEHVQKHQTNPVWYGTLLPPPPSSSLSSSLIGLNDPSFSSSSSSNGTHNSYCASLDGDADRIVFFKDLILLDGDKIACLIANFIRKQLDLLLLSGGGDTTTTTTSSTTTTTTTTMTLPTLGVVQTAYANGASSQYLQRHNIDVTLAKTGVKYVHQAAHDRYDIGIYFEANGHGTVLFGDRYYDLLHNHPKPTTVGARQALIRLAVLPTLINQAVGDAISDLLLVDAILQMEDMTIAQWSELYHDLPSKQTKLSVPDRTMIQTNDTETQCLQPKGLQEALDRAVAQHNGGGDPHARAFVRPSGTENVVRVYAEATTNPEALASAAEDIVRQFCCSPSSKI